MWSSCPYKKHSLYCFALEQSVICFVQHPHSCDLRVSSGIRKWSFLENRTRMAPTTNYHSLFSVLSSATLYSIFQLLASPIRLVCIFLFLAFQNSKYFAVLSFLSNAKSSTKKTKPSYINSCENLIPILSWVRSEELVAAFSFLPSIVNRFLSCVTTNFKSREFLTKTSSDRFLSIALKHLWMQKSCRKLQACWQLVCLKQKIGIFGSYNYLSNQL